MMKWIATSAASLVWGTLVFSLGLTLAFPGDFITKHMALMVQEGTNKKMLLHVDDASYSVLSGINLRNVSLFESKPGRRSPGEKSLPPRDNTLLTTLDRVYLSPSYLPLLRGMLEADIGLDLTGGRLTASIGASPSAFQIGSDTEDFDLSHHPIPLGDDTINVSGLLNIDGDLTLNRDDIKASEGDFGFTITDFGLTGGSIGGFTLMETQFSEAELKFDVEDGKAKVSKGSFIGDMLEATVDGHITLRKDPLKSRLSLKIQVRFDDTIDKLAKIALKDARDKDGVYHFRGRGTLTNPRWSTDRQTKRTSTTRRTAGNDDGDSSNLPSTRSSRSTGLSDADREERRAKRKERLKERRERMKKRREERRARQREREEREEQDDYGRIDEQQFDEREIPPDPDLDDPVFEEEVEPEYNDFEDPNDPNTNMEDLGYIDE
ncbi:MAG: type II secretion system protein GspN [Myxococcota bacterium]|nr:type II secretion system protein GspN [Myxococcota bacterium]